MSINSDTSTLGKPVRMIRVMIAFPGDVSEFIADIFNELYKWNLEHSEAEEVILLPKAWTENVNPVLGDEPQAIINNQIVNRSDILIAVFRFKLGTPTFNSLSGTAEEIMQFYNSGRSAKVYFSDELLSRNHDKDSLKALDDYKSFTSRLGIYDTFISKEELLKKIGKHIYKEVRSLKETNFKFTPRKLVLQKYKNLEDIGEINKYNWQDKVVDIVLFIINSPSNNPIFRREFNRTDLPLLYQVVLHTIGVRFNKVNKDTGFKKLYKILIDENYFKPTKNIQASHGYDMAWRYSELISKIIPDKKYAPKDRYFGFKINKNVNMYVSALEKLKSKGLDVSLIDNIPKMLENENPIELHLPDYIIDQVREINENEFERLQQSSIAEKQI